MSLYRLYYMAPDGSFTGIVQIDFKDDAAAHAEAESRLGDHHAMEVYRGKERIARIDGAAGVGQPPSRVEAA